MMWGWGTGNWIIGFLLMVLFWGVLVALMVLTVRAWDGGGRNGSPDAHRPDAREILEERFAKGELSEHEFEERRRVLEPATREGQGGPSPPAARLTA